MASKTKVRPRTKSKQQRDEVHEDTGLGPDEDSHEKQGENGRDGLVTKIEQILDVKLTNLKSDWQQNNASPAFVPRYWSKLRPSKSLKREP